MTSFDKQPPEQGDDGTPERGDDGLAAQLIRLVTSSSEDRSERARELAALARALARTARVVGGRAFVGGRWLVETLIDVAPRIPVRDRETLRAQYPGLDDTRIAEALIRSAARATGVVGAAGGAVSAASWTVPPSMLLSAPVEVGAETLAVAAIEVKLVAELHALYGITPRGGPLQRTQAYTMSWANGRGIDPTDPKWMATTLGGAAKATIRRRMMGRAARGVTTLGPLLTGAVAGAVVNRRGTKALGERIQKDLRANIWRAE